MTPTFGEANNAMLAEIARRHGTPLYAYDQRSLRTQVEKLQRHLPQAVQILYSLKANASLGLSDVLADCGIGADVASAGEFLTALEAGFPASRIFVAGPVKSAETVSLLQEHPEAIVSIDSADELAVLARKNIPNRAVLRLRPDFVSVAVVTAGADCRFGGPLEEVKRCGELLSSCSLEVIGFHVFAGSQVLSAPGVLGHLRGAVDLSLRASEMLGIVPEFLNLGGGFGVPYAAGEQELDLDSISEELDALIARARPARLALELGRYLVAQAGWYVTSVVGRQTHQGRPAVIVDGGTHQRTDFCGVGLRCKASPPLVLNAATGPLTPTDVLGCLSLPADVLAEAARLPPLGIGDVLAFEKAGAYGLWSSPALFHGYPLPAEVIFDGSTIQLIRHPQCARSILADQMHAPKKHAAADSAEKVH